MTALPNGWVERSLNDVCRVTLGQSPPGTTYNDTGEGDPFFQGKAEFGSRHPVVRKWTTGGTKFADAGDILISVRAPVGPTNVADTRCAIGRGLAALSPLPGVMREYVLLYLQQSESVLASQGTGTTFSAISGDVLRRHPIPVAPLEEQRAIVEILEDHLSRLDSACLSLESAERRG